MELPPGFAHREGKRVVYRLINSLYGLKQTSRQRNIKLTITLVESDFQQSHFDYSLFAKHHGSNIVVVLIYINDLLITGNDHKLILHTKKVLQDRFKIKDLGDLRYFLGIEFARRNEDGILMH